MISELIAGDNIREDIARIITEMHTLGPTNTSSLERLAYYKRFHHHILSEYESQIINVMGLFYKPVSEPTTILEEVYKLFSQSIEDEYGVSFTPVQASAYKYITEDRYFSFSAPTSAGKSFLFRELVKSTAGDMVIIVPSRALIAEYYQEIIEIVDNETLVLQFIDNINTNKTRRRIFIITPERGNELFGRIGEFNIEIFLFDEAQIAEEKIRGMRFDAFVRRADRALPKAKKVFAHPFVRNPDAQLKKHDFADSAHAYNYQQQSVGKIFLEHSAGSFSYFSPHSADKERIPAPDIVEEVLRRNGTLLAYVSKGMIYSNRLAESFSKYISLCEEVVDPLALAIISKLRDFIGASKSGNEKFSLMIAMMERGIVIHHGSMPLKSRFLVEEFIRKGFARICFSTSTLGQGINMPFSVVWVKNRTAFQEILTLKNLIGRAGRTSKYKNEFDFGYTIIENRDVDIFKSKYSDEYVMSEASKIETVKIDKAGDDRDIAEAVINDSYNNEFNIPEIQIDRIKSGNIFDSIKYVLDSLFVEDSIIDGNNYYEMGDVERKKLKDEFGKIYCSHLRKKNLTKAEKSVISAAIPILLWRVRSKSFSEIVTIRYGYISRRNEREAIRREFLQGIIDEYAMNDLISNLKTKYTPIAGTIPNKTLRAAPLYGEDASVRDVSYDIVVYDTYDYLDKVISISMADPLCAAFKLYYDATSDKRALILFNQIRYGTDDNKEIWLLRYGFSSDDFDWLTQVVEDIDSRQIYFNDKLSQLNEDQLALVARYL